MSDAPEVRIWAKPKPKRKHCPVCDKEGRYLAHNPMCPVSLAWAELERVKGGKP